MNELDFNKKHVIEELERLGVKDVEKLSYDELVRRLATIRALEVDINHDDNKWF